MGFPMANSISTSITHQGPACGRLVDPIQKFEDRQRGLLVDHGDPQKNGWFFMKDESHMRTMVLEYESQHLGDFWGKCLSGWWFEPNPSEKYDIVNWDDDIPNIWENKKCSKPPTSCC